MFPLSVISHWCPFAPAALPAFIAHMGTSDSRPPPPSSSLFRLVRGCAQYFKRRWPGLLGYRAFAMSGSTRLSNPGWVPPARQYAGETVACWRLETIGPLPRGHFGTSSPSGSALPVTFAPRLLSYLRIKHVITATPARLDTWPVASGYQGGIHTRSTTRHCQAAPRPDPCSFLDISVIRRISSENKNDWFTLI